MSETSVVIGQEPRHGIRLFFLVQQIIDHITEACAFVSSSNTGLMLDGHFYIGSVNQFLANIGSATSLELVLNDMSADVQCFPPGGSTETITFQSAQPLETIQGLAASACGISLSAIDLGLEFARCNSGGCTGDGCTCDGATLDTIV